MSAPLSACPCPPPQKAGDSAEHLSMGGKRGSQGSSHPESQVHTRSLRGFPWVPIFSPALKNVIPGPHVSAAASLPEHHKKKTELLGKSVGVADVSLLGVLRVPTATLGSLLQHFR